MASQLKLEPKVEKIEIKGSTKERVKKTHTSELIFAVCSPIGTIKNPVVDSLEKNLKTSYNYEVERIKITDFIDQFYKEEKAPIENKTEAYVNLIHKIKGGNHIRENYKNKSILVELAVSKIHEGRNERSGGSDKKAINSLDLKSKRICYIIDSLKTKEEAKLLRSIYGDIFYLFGVFSPLEERKNNLTSKDLSPSEVEKLIDTDDYETSDYGQDVRNCFVESDFFVRSSE